MTREQKEKRQLFYWEGLPSSLSEYDDLRKHVKNFKNEEAGKILSIYFANEDDYKFKHNDKTFRRFKPIEDFKDDQQIERIGLFSTVAGLEIVSLYDSEFKKKEISLYINVIKHYPELIEFVIKGVTGSFKPNNKIYGATPGYLSCITTLNTLHDSFIGSYKKESFSHILRNKKLYRSFYKKCIENVLFFSKELREKEERIHPFILYSSLKFINNWKDEICMSFKQTKLINTIKIKEMIDQCDDTLLITALKNSNSSFHENPDDLVDHFFDRIYIC